MMMMMTMVIIIVIIIISLSAGNSHSDHCDGAKVGDDDDYHFFTNHIKLVVPTKQSSLSPDTLEENEEEQTTRGASLPSGQNIISIIANSPTFINEYIIILIPSSSETWRLKGLVLTTTPDSAAGRRAVKGQKGCLSRQGEYH